LGWLFVEAAVILHWVSIANDFLYYMELSMNMQKAPALDIIRSRRLSEISLEAVRDVNDIEDPEWARIEGDFQPSQRQRLRDTLFAGGAPDARLARYVQQRASLDALVENCDRVHARIAAVGTSPELVELYAQARDRYEDAVELLGAFREDVQAALDTGSPPAALASPILPA
jgi:hypothetical protein